MTTLKLVYGDDIRRVLLEDVTVPGLVNVITTIFAELRASPFRVAWRDEDGDNIFVACQADLDEAIRFAKQENLPALRLFVVPVSNPTPTPTSAVPPKTEPSPVVVAPAPSVAPSVAPSAAAQPLLIPRSLSNSSVTAAAAPVSLPASNPPASAPASAPAAAPAAAAPAAAAPAAAPVETRHVPRAPRPEPAPSRFSASSRHQARPPYAGPVQHVGVTCDGCNLPLYGIRYKCTDCYDFDLCERCEASNVHPESHILLKIRLPLRQRLIPTWEDGVRPYGGCPYGSAFGRRYHHRRSHVPEDDAVETIERQFRDARLRPEQQPQQPSQQQTQPQQTQPQQAQPVQQPALSVAAPPASAPTPTPVEQPQQPQQAVPQEYAQELELLHSMGFYNDERNLYYLRRTLGRIDAVIDSLTQLHF